MPREKAGSKGFFYLIIEAKKVGNPGQSKILPTNVVIFETKNPKSRNFQGLIVAVEQKIKGVKLYVFQ